VGRPAVGWLDSVREHFKTMSVKNWRRKPQDRHHWRAIVKEAKVLNGLYRPQKKKKKQEIIANIELLEHHPELRSVTNNTYT
jgi:hypothetical protein